MKTIDRYILAKTMVPLTACLAIALTALLLERLVQLLDYVVNKGGPFFIILKMLANLIPHYLGIAVPAAFFVGILLAVMRLSGDSELDAIAAMGVGLRRLLLPLMALAVLLMVGSAVIIGVLQPYTRYAYRALVYTVTHTAWNNALTRGSFFIGPGNMTIMIDGFADGGRDLRGIFLHDVADDGRATTVTAEHGQLLRSTDNLQLSLRLSKGALIERNVDDRTIVLSFGRADVPLDRALGPITFRARGEEERELTLWELWLLRQSPPSKLPLARIDSEINARLVRIVSLLVLPLTAIPLGIVSRRARRSVGLVVGLILLAIYHHVLQFGESLADVGKVSPLIGLWLPFLVFSALSLWAFNAADSRPGYNPMTATIDRLSEALEAVARRLRRRRVSI